MTNGSASPGSSTPGLAAHDVWLRYGPKREWALAGAELSIPTGCLAALVGPNGSGKTTLFRTWLDFQQPDRGSVEVLGLDPTEHQRDVLMRTAYVAQEPALYGALTCREHHRFAAIQRDGFDVAAAEGALGKVAVPLDVKASTLSGGQRVQLALSIARGCNARVLLLDEPLANLDPVARREVVRTLADYAHERDATVLVSSHLVNDLEGTFDHLVAMGNGRVLVSDPIETVLNRYVVAPTRLDAPIETGEMGRFVGRDGTLVRVLDRASASGNQDTTQATIEDVVMAVLTASQPTAAGH